MKTSSTVKAPVVSVPVLSVKSMSMLPAVSIPTRRRTRTPFFIIRFMLKERTTVIIMGSPSGTATTRMEMARVRAPTASRMTKRVSVSRSRATAGFCPASNQKASARWIRATTAAET